MLSPFVERKRVLGFYFFNLSRDGLVKKEDFAAFGRGVADLLRVGTGTSQHEKLMAAYLGAWEAFGKPADANGDDAITLSEFLAAYAAFTSSPGAREAVIGINATFFDALDGNGDGRVDLAEYTAFLGPAGIGASRAETAFRHLDRDGDGFVSRSEFTSDWWEYWNSDDRSAPGNWVFG